MKITILNGSKDNWFDYYARTLIERLKLLNHEVLYIQKKESIIEGDICFILSFPFLIQEELLKRNKHNIVVHASDLPKGKGFSPLQWQILEGKNEITLTLFEVDNEVDSGPFYLKEKIRFSGTELYEELRSKLGNKIIEMCVYFIKHKDQLEPKKQSGEGSFYKKRTEKDDEIDPHRTIAEQFDHFRIADNENFPLWFSLRNQNIF